MSKNSKNTAATNSTSVNVNAEAMSAKEFKQSSYDAYLAYVEFMEGKKPLTETVDALSPLMAAYGLTLTIDNIVYLLTARMAGYGKDKGEKARKVKSISTFRGFVKGGWREVEAAPVHSSAGNDPANSKTPAKAKGQTKAEMEAEIKRLRALIPAESAPAASAPESSAPTTEEKAA